MSPSAPAWMLDIAGCPFGEIKAVLVQLADPLLDVPDKIVYCLRRAVAPFPVLGMAYFGARRPLISVDADHLFQSMPTALFARSRPPVSVMPTTRRGGARRP